MKKFCAKVSHKSICLILIFMLTLACSGIGALAAWDGYVEEASEQFNSGTHTLVDMNDYSLILNSGAVPSQKYTKGTSYSARWNNQNAITTIQFGKVLRDWSDYVNFEMWVYSEKATNSQFIIVASCDQEMASGESYRSYFVTVDWEGWKLVKIPLNSFSKNREGSLAKVNSLRFQSSGWDMNPNPETDLYISSIYLTGGDVSDSLTMMFSTEQVDNTNQCAENALVLYSEMDQAMYNLEKFIPAENTAAMIYDGESYKALPSVFEKFGATVTEDGLSVNITAGDKTVTLTAEEKDGTKYIDAIQAAKELGKTAIRHKKLLLIGDENVNMFYEDVNAIDILSYEVCYKPLDLSTITDEDFKILKDKWRARIVGSETLDMENEYVKNKAAAFSGGLDISNAMRKGPDIKNLFQDEPITTSAEMYAMYQQIYTMARTWAMRGSPGYHDEELLENIKYALEWMYDNIYGWNVTTRTVTWRSPYTYNWWDWQIGATVYGLIPTLMLIEEELEYEDICRYLEPVHTLIEAPVGDGANLADLTSALLGAALLEKDAKAFVKTRRYIDRLMIYTEDGAGFHRDGSYIYHGVLPYNSGYGLTHLGLLVELSTLVEGSKLEISNPMKYNVFDMVYDSFESITYKGGMFCSFVGRSISRNSNEHQYGLTYVGHLLSLLDMAEGEDVAKLKAMIKYHATHDTTMDYCASVGFENIEKLLDIMEDDSIPSDYSSARTMIMHDADRAIHKRDDYAAVVAMSSERIGDYDSINNENMRGWYTSDGMLYLYGQDLKAFDAMFWSTVNPYKLPGVTNDMQKRPEVSIYNTWLREQDFVGGASLESKYAAVAMDLESYNFDEEDEGRDEYGEGKPKHNSTLVAKKAWFMFDDEVVALGSDINSTDNVDVITTIDNRKSREMDYVPDEQSVTYEIVGFDAPYIPEAHNPPEASYDNDMSTKYAVDGDATITYDLGSVKKVGFAAIAFTAGNSRKTTFDILVSEDGEKFEKVFSGQNSGTTTNYETYSLGNKYARYIRVTGHGNTSNTWNTIAEIVFYAPRADGKITLGNAVYRGKEKIYKDGSLIDLDANEKFFRNAKWVNNENIGGYYFPNGQNIYMVKTNTNPSFFELWINHGKNPSKATYEYVMLPNMTPDQTAEYAQNPNVEILSNTEKVQAAKSKKANTTGYVFWEKGSFGDITTATPGIIMLKETDDGAVLSVSDPTQKLETMEVAITKEYWLDGEVEDAEVTTGGGKTKVTVDTHGSEGKTFEIKLKKKAGNGNEENLGNGNGSNDGNDDTDGSGSSI